MAFGMIVAFLVPAAQYEKWTLPLRTSTGAGAGARHSIGTGVIGGVLASTFLAMIFVPVFFVLLTLATRTGRRRTCDRSAFGPCGA